MYNIDKMRCLNGEIHNMLVKWWVGMEYSLKIITTFISFLFKTV